MLMSNTKHEDAIMKMGFRYFRDQILKMLGIDYNYVDIGPTELVELTIHSLFMDFTFLTTEDFYIHVEFQTTDSGEEDLRRFHAYEAVFSHETGKNVLTYVIYSGGITKVRDTLDCGKYEYKISPIYLKQKNADEILRYLQQKQKNGECFTDEDFAKLSLTPLMNSTQGKKETIKTAILFAKQDNSEIAEKTMAILYTLADKFLQGNELKEIKEVVAMTRLGQMLYDDGLKDGKSEGREVGRKEGSNRMAALTKVLLENGKMAELQLAIDDQVYREKLMDEYEIK